MNTDGYVPWNGIWDVDYHELSYEKAVEIKNQLRERMQERAEMLLRRVAEVKRYRKIGGIGPMEQAKMIAGFLWSDLPKHRVKSEPVYYGSPEMIEEMKRMDEEDPEACFAWWPSEPRDQFLAVDLGLYLVNIATQHLGPGKWSVVKAKTMYNLNMAVCTFENKRQVCPVHKGRTLLSAYCERRVKKNLFVENVAICMGKRI